MTSVNEELWTQLRALQARVEEKRFEMDGLCSHALGIASNAQDSLLVGGETDPALVGQLYRIVGALETVEAALKSIAIEISEGPLEEEYNA